MLPITVTVSGPAKSGKSTIAAYIKDYLQSRGFTGIHYQDDLNVLFFHSMEEQALTEKVCIAIREETISKSS